MTLSATDVHGKKVHVGSSVRVISILPSVSAPLDEDERARVKSMIGEVFRVDDIDEYRQVWVHKEWPGSLGVTDSHGLGLESHEFELVDDVT